jgi:hypothetical protein
MHASPADDAAKLPNHLSPNAIVLDFARPFHERLRTLVDLGPSEPGRTVDGAAFFLLFCWHVKHEDPDRFERSRRPGEARAPLADAPEIRGLVDESFDAIGGPAGWNRMLRLRDYCECGQSSRLENLAVCVDCGRYWCWECDRSRCGGHEIVG